MLHVVTELWSTMSKRRITWESSSPPSLFTLTQLGSSYSHSFLPYLGSTSLAIKCPQVFSYFCSLPFILFFLICVVSKLTFHCLSSPPLWVKRRKGFHSHNFSPHNTHWGHCEALKGSTLYKLTLLMSLSNNLCVTCQWTPTKWE